LFGTTKYWHYNKNRYNHTCFFLLRYIGERGVSLLLSTLPT
jgi:hypothetical protein